MDVSRVHYDCVMDVLCMLYGCRMEDLWMCYRCFVEVSRISLFVQLYVGDDLVMFGDIVGMSLGCSS